MHVSFAGLAFAAALAAQEPDAILARLSAEATNVLVVHDPLPVLERVLAAPVTKQLLDGTRDLQREAFGRSFDVAALQQQLALAAPLIPVECVVAAPTRTMDRLSHAASLFACWSLLSALGRDGQQDGGEAADLRAAASQDLAQLDAAPLQAWLRLRDERTAEAWFDGAVAFLRGCAQESGLALEVADGRLDVRTVPFGPGAPLRRLLEAVGIDVARAPASEVHAVLAQTGAQLSLRVGALAPGPCEVRRFGERWRERGALVFARSEASDAKASFTAAYQGIVALGSVGTGADRAEQMVRLVGFLERMGTLFATQTFTIACDGGLAWAHETGAGSSGVVLDPVPPSLLRLGLPGEATFVSSDTLDVVLAGALDLLADGVVPAGAPAEPLADYLAGDASAVFAPGVFALFRPTQMQSMQGADQAPMPLAAVALVARVKTPADAEAFVREVARQILAIARVEAAAFRERDLGLGVPTHALALDVLAPALVARGIDRDFLPHWIVTDELLIVSTDATLTKDLLARARGDAAPMVEAGALLERAFVRGETLAAWLAGMRAWNPLVNEWQGHAADFRGPFFAALHAACALVDTVEHRAEIRTGVLRATTALRLRAGR